MGKLFMTLFDDKKKTPVSRTTAQDAEDLTREERLSRMLHTPKPKVRLPKNVPLFEHFIVVGLANHTATEPSIVYHYPDTPVGIPGVEDFCFPTGVGMEVMKPTTCQSNLMEMRHNQEYLKHPERSFVFLLTNEDSTVYYGICIHKKELLEDAPFYMDGPLIPEKFHASTMRCYCLITKYPFFRLHLDFLQSVFAVEHLTRLVEEAPQKEEAPVVRLPPGSPGAPPSFKRSTTVSSLSRSSDLRRSKGPETKAERLARRRKTTARSSSVAPEIGGFSSAAAAASKRGAASRIRSLETDCSPPADVPSQLAEAPAELQSVPPAVAEENQEACEVVEAADKGASPAAAEPAQEEAPAEGAAAAEAAPVPAVGDTTATEAADAAADGGGPAAPATDTVQVAAHEQPAAEAPAEEAAATGSPGHSRTKSPLHELTSLEQLEAPPEAAESASAPEEVPVSPLQRCRAARTRSHSQPVKMRPLRPGDPNHPVIDALERYRTTPVPEKGQTLSFETSVYLNQIRFTRPYFDEEEEIFAEWGLPITFFTLSISNICHLLSSILLERKVVLLSSNVRYLSALVLSFPPLIRPFLYQSVIIPALPVKMHNFLDAPVPFVVGLTELPAVMPDDIIVVNVDKNKVIAKAPIPRLPGYKDLVKRCTVYHEQLKKTFGKTPPFQTTKEQMSLVDSLSTVFETFFTKMFTNFHNYTMRNLTDPSKPISVFMKDAFLFDHPHESFLTPFVETQVFFDYQDKRLRKRDKFKVHTM